MIGGPPGGGAPPPPAPPTGAAGGPPGGGGGICTPGMYTPPLGTGDSTGVRNLDVLGVTGVLGGGGGGGRATAGGSSGPPGARAASAAASSSASLVASSSAAAAVASGSGSVTSLDLVLTMRYEIRLCTLLLLRALFTSACNLLLSRWRVQKIVSMICCRK